MSEEAKARTIAQPLMVALDVMREQGDPMADACHLAIASALTPPPRVTEWARHLVIGLYQLGAIYGGGEPLRLGMPRRLVTALAREAHGKSPENQHALPVSVSFNTGLHERAAELDPLFINGRYVFTVDEFVLQGPTGPVTFFATD